MGWAARAKVRSGNPKTLNSSAGGVLSGLLRITASDGTRYIGRAGGALRLAYPRVRGKAAVKAAKRQRTYDWDGRRVISIAV